MEGQEQSQSKEKYPGSREIEAKVSGQGRDEG